MQRASWRDSPLCSFVCENGAAAIIAFSRLAVTAKVRFGPQTTGRGTKLLVIWFGYIVSERMQLLLHWLLVHKVYRHIPYFHPAEQIGFGNAGGSVGIPSTHGGFRRIVLEWMRVSAGSQLILAVLTVTLLGRNASTNASGKAIASGLSWLQWLRWFTKGFNPLTLCAKLAIVRCVVDVCFAAGHWLIHRPAIWNSLLISHRTHHEHHHPSVLTNQARQPRLPALPAVCVCCLCTRCAVLRAGVPTEYSQLLPVAGCHILYRTQLPCQLLPAALQNTDQPRTHRPRLSVLMLPLPGYCDRVLR
jgi:hypothetical protein